MSILRFAARSLLASFFIVEGAKAITKPAARVPAAEKVTEKLLPLVDKVAPPSLTGVLPEDPRTWVRINGAAQVLGGVGLATGFARRPSAALLGVTMLPHVLTARPDKADAPVTMGSQSLFFRNLALLGGVVLAAQDTEGKPSVAWRASDTRRRLAKEGRKQKREVLKKAEQVKKDLQAKIN